MYDIIIIGAGPAGSNLARLLNQTQYKICIIDKRNLDLPNDQFREKSCGGLLSPEAQKMLAKLELSIPKSVLEDPQFFKVRTIDFDNHIENDYQRHYLNMNRERFDRYLFQLIPDSIDKICGAMVNQIATTENVWKITYKGLEATQHITGKFLVIADGAHSFTRRQLFPNHPAPHLYVSRQEWYPLKKNMPYFTGIFDSKVTDYYAWTIQKNDALILGCAFPAHSNVKESMNTLRKKTSIYLDVDLTNPFKKEGGLIYRTSSSAQLLWSSTVDGCPVALIGEAAGATSPTSAEGFSYALKSSLYLYEALRNEMEGAALRYKQSCKKIEANIFLKKLKSPAMYNKTLRKCVMQSKLTALK